MKQKGFFFLRIPVLCCALLLAAASASVYRALRMVWVFYEPNVHFLGGAMGIFLLMLLTLGVVFALLLLRLYAPQRDGKQPGQGRFCRALSTVSFVLSALFAVAVTAILILSGAETNSVMLMYLQKDLPIIISFCFAAVLLCVLPNLRGKGKVVLAALMALLLAGAGLWQIFPLKAYRIISAPVVMDTGEDYSVVFATNDVGTGYVRYSFEGKDYTVYAQKTGRRVGGRLIHAVHVPYAHLKNNRYTVGSTRILEEYSYGSRLGKDVTAGPYTLQVNERDTQTYLVISDWHTYLKDAKAAVSHLGSYDGLIMLGDPAPGMDFEQQAVRYIVQFGGELTNGAMPVVYVRGNHETRGAFADELADSLGYDRFYYTVDRSPYTFLVLDSGEDKPDDHVEYGGMDDYRLNRSEMLRWLQTKPQTNDRLIVLSHAWQISEPEPEVSRAAWEVLDRMHARFMISGHTHHCEFLDADNPDAQPYLAAYPDITTYIDGGHAGKTYIASKLTLTEQSVHFEAVDNFGNRVIDEVLDW